MTETHAATREWGLTRMILVDSYSRGHIVEMDLAEGAVITGINGQGKTTLLQLIPLFHGEEPGRIVARLEGRDSFYEHFLKSLTSYIVFEYARADGELCLAVQYSNQQGTQIHHRFVPGGYRREWFVDEDERFVETHAFALRLKSMGVKPSTQIETRKAYRDVLHRTAQRGTSEYNTAALYSIVPYGSRINGLERIINGMFSREANFDDLQNIVVRTIREDSTTLKLVADRIGAERWVSSVGAYKRVMALRPRYEAALGYDASRLAAEKGMIQDIGMLKGHVAWSIGRVVELEMDRRRNEARRTQLKDVDEPALQEMRDDASRQGSEHKALLGEARKYDRTVQEHEAMKMASRSGALDRLPMMQSTLNQDVLRLSQLTSIAEEAKSHADVRRVSARMEEDTRRAAIDASDNAATEDSEERIRSIRTEHDRRTSQTSDANSAEDQRMRAEHGDAVKRYEQAAAAVRNPMASPEIAAALKRAQQTRHDADAKERTSRREKSRLDTELARSQRNQTLAERALEKARTNRSATERSLDEATAFVRGEPGTLLAMLREDGGPAADELSRIIRTEVLVAPGIRATKVDDATSLHGYAIDATGFEPDSRVDLEKAKERQQAAADADRQAVAELDDATSTMKDAVRATAAATSAATLADVNTTAAEKEAETAETTLRRAQNEHDRAIREAVRAAESLEDQRSKELDEVEARQAAAIGLREEAARNAQHAITTMIDEAHARLRELRLGFEKARIESRTAYDVDMRSIADDLARMLEGRGVDPSEIRGLEERIADTRSSIGEIERDRGLVMQWRAWAKDEPLIHMTRLATIESMKVEMDRMATAIEKAMARISEERSSIAAEAEALKAAVSSVDEARSHSENRIANGVRDLGQDPEPIEWNAADKAGNVQASLSRNANARTEARIRLDKEVQALDNVFLQVPDTQVHDYRDRGRHEYAGASVLDGYRRWYEEVHEDSRNILANDAKGLAGQVIEFHRDLLKFEGDIVSFNKELQKHLGDATAFDGLEDLDIRIVSKVKEVDYWDKVRDVSEAAASWLLNASEAIPGEGFINALQGLLFVWKKTGTIDTNLRSLVRIEGEAREKGNLRKFTNSEQLKNVSSNGLSYLVLVSIFIAFVNRMRAGAPTTITWPLDELKAIDRTNTGRLVELLRRNRIELVTAFPDPDPDVMREFGNRYGLDGSRRLIQAVVEGA
jgi:energy-coupling factor transporter ATP-binding protein EcfA2